MQHSDDNYPMGWIISRPDLLGGRPCIRGTRLSVQFILELLARGSTPKDILAAFPQLNEEALLAAIRHGEEQWK